MPRCFARTRGLSLSCTFAGGIALLYSTTIVVVEVVLSAYYVLVVAQKLNCMSAIVDGIYIPPV